MEEPRFDPGAYYQFDLAQGQVRSRAGHRVVVWSDEVASALVSTALAANDTAALGRLGALLAAEVKRGLSNAAEESPEAVATHASGVLGLFGLGTLRMEQWGDALVVAIDGAPSLDSQHRALGAIVGGLFGALIGQDIAAISVGDDTRFLLVDRSAESAVSAWTKQGLDLGAIVSRLSPEPA